MLDRSRHRAKPRPFRQIEKRLKRTLVALAVAVIPRLYLAYMWLVWKTSRVETIGPTPNDFRERYGRGVIAIWHDEVFFVAWAFGVYRPATLASRGDFGEVITRMLQLCDFEVFRGGSSSGRRRRSVEVVDEMIQYMQDNENVVYGITTDGSAGPRYRMKKGAVRIAAACKAPVGVQKTWCRRYVRLRTWDRTIIPLPFNHIVHCFAGPFFPPSEAADDTRAFVRFSRTVETELLNVTWIARRRIEGDAANDLFDGFPKSWKPPAEPVSLDRDVPGSPDTGSARASGGGS